MQGKTREWQKKVDAFYERLTNVEFKDYRLWRKLKESSSVSASDDASGRPVSRRIEKVPVEETVAGAKDAFAEEAAVIALASAITTYIPGIATQIEQAVERVAVRYRGARQAPAGHLPYHHRTLLSSCVCLCVCSGCFDALRRWSL